VVENSMHFKETSTLERKCANLAASRGIQVLHVRTYLDRIDDINQVDLVLVNVWKWQQT